MGVYKRDNIFIKFPKRRDATVARIGRQRQECITYTHPHNDISFSATIPICASFSNIRIYMPHIDRECRNKLEANKLPYGRKIYKNYTLFYI